MSEYYTLTVNFCACIEDDRRNLKQQMRHEGLRHSSWDVACKVARSLSKHPACESVEILEHRELVTYRGGRRTYR